MFALQRTPWSLILLVASTALAVLAATVGLWLVLDASLLAGRSLRRGHDLSSAAIRAAGVAILALAQVVAMAGVARGWSRRQAGDVWFIRIAGVVALFAAFAAVVLALAGRQ